jgi:transposase-like protein
MAQTLPTAVAALRRRPGGPRRWTAADKAAYLAAFATSPLSIKAFCAETGVPRATFTLWQGEARAAARAHRGAPSRRRRKTPAFARVELVPPPPATGGIGGMVLVMRGPAGVEAELTGLDAATLTAVLHAVFGAGARPAR